MENSFLKKSGLTLGFLLSISPLVQAEESDSALDNPAVLQQLLKLIAEKAETTPVVNSDALNDPAIMQKLLSQLKAAQQEPVADASLFDDPKLMEKLLGKIAEAEKANAVEPAAPSALDSGDVLVGLLPLMAGIETETPAEIFEPVPYTYSFDDSLPEQKGMIGLSLAQQSSDTFGEQLVFGGNFRYHLTDRFDALLNIELGLTSLGNGTIYKSDGTTVALEENASFRSITTGIGYSLLKGIASTGNDTFIPWQLNVEGLVGEQFSGSSHGLYTGVGATVQFLLDDYWIGTSTRYFNVDDSVLNKAGTHRGLQWGINFGFYY